MQNGARVLTCVYCGHEYPQDTPASGNEVLTDHIRQCEKHPMRLIEQENKLLRTALVQLIGADGIAELEAMEATIRSMPAPDEDKRTTINAIHALIKTVR